MPSKSHAPPATSFRLQKQHVAALQLRPPHKVVQTRRGVVVADAAAHELSAPRQDVQIVREHLRARTRERETESRDKKRRQLQPGKGRQASIAFGAVRNRLKPRPHVGPTPEARKRRAEPCRIQLALHVAFSLRCMSHSACAA
eukprot:3179481-Pleurochrysis_carterae.AAC.1